MENKKRKQLCFDVPPEVHKAIKMVVAEKGVSINYWIMSLILGALIKDGYKPGEDSGSDV